MFSLKVKFVWLSLAVASCTDPGAVQNESARKISSSTREQRPSVSNREYPEKFIHQDEFYLAENRVIVSTSYINDTLNESEAWEAVQWPIVERQTMTFKRNDSVIEVLDFPSKSIWRTTKSGKKIKAAEIVIWHATFIEGMQENFFMIPEASALCIGSYCPTYDGVFTMTGLPVYQLFKGEDKQTILQIGADTNMILKFSENEPIDSSTIYENNHLTNEMFRKALDNRKCVGLNCD